MRRYYFDLNDGNGLFVDEEGLECADTHAVQAEAARALADMTRDAVSSSATDVPSQSMSIDVRDDNGPVMQVRLTLEFTKAK